MTGATRLVAVAVGGLLVVAGLALGAESQDESFLEPDAAERDRANQGAAGNLVVLTALVAALGIAVAAAALSARGGLARLRQGAALGASAYALVVLVQSSWPNNFGALEARRAAVSNSLIAANVPAVPSLFVPVFALVLAAALATGWSLGRLLGRAGPPSPEDLLGRQAAFTLLLAPFLAVAAWGNVALLLDLPHGRPDLSPYLVVLPLAALACLLLLGTALAKAWRLGSYVRNGRLAASVAESWQGLGRAERAGAAALLALAAVAGLFPAADLDGLYGGSFGVTLRGHTQLLALLAVPLVPAWRHHRHVARFLAAAPLHRATLETGTHPLAVATAAAAGAALALAGLATWAADGALWAWLLAIAPPAAVAAVRIRPAAAAPLLALLAFTLWAIGNTVVARYDGDLAILEFRDPPGLLALWRALGALALAVLVARLVQDLAAEERSALVVPLSLGVGACAAAVALIEMPLAAWLLHRGTGEAVVVGSVMASLDGPVRILLHSLAAGLGLAGALGLARLLRPDWFRPPPHPPLPAAPPVPAPLRAKARRARPTAAPAASTGAAH